MNRTLTFDGTVAPDAGGADRLGALPDELLQHTLSFLPSRDAVRTCLLARRWRHQWKSTPALRITGVDSFESGGQLNDFVNHLIVLRNWTPLHACEIEAYSEYDDDRAIFSGGDNGFERSRYTGLWIRYALACHARLLGLSDRDPDNLIPEHERLQLVYTPIASPHLTTLELNGVLLGIPYNLDFSACPNLQTVKMNRCDFTDSISYHAPVKISSPSMRFLSITDYWFIPYAVISVPCLVYLELAGSLGFAPEFETMPSLLTASIKLDHGSTRDDKDGSLLLGRLSDATNLVLIAEPQMFAAFRKDLKCCTTFSKLKTLLLNDWCVEPDFRPLLYFLPRSPSLQKLKLRLSKPYQNAQGTVGSYDMIKPFLASRCLRAVKIKCLAKDERVHKIVKVLSSCGVPAEKIKIKEKKHS